MRARYAKDDDDDVVVSRSQNASIAFDPHHTHEFEESTKLAETGDDRHNHRVAGVTSEPIAVPGGHVHAIDKANTDFLDHHHEIGVTDVITGINIPIPGTNKHVHVVSGTTTVMDQHSHDFLFTTQIDSPLV